MTLPDLAAGELVLLEEQDRTRWDAAMIAEGEGLVERGWSSGRSGPAGPVPTSFTPPSPPAIRRRPPSRRPTGARQIALLYGELMRHEPSPVVEANRAVAVAMAKGPAAGLVILDALGHHRQPRRWSRLHEARAELLVRLGRDDKAVAAYRRALELEPAAAERAFITRRVRGLGAP